MENRQFVFTKLNGVSTTQTAGSYGTSYTSIKVRNTEGVRQEQVIDIPSQFKSQTVQVQEAPKKKTKRTKTQKLWKFVVEALVTALKSLIK